MVICLFTCVHCVSKFLIHFEAWAKLAQQWLVCAPLGIYFKPINKELMLLVTMVGHMNLSKTQLCVQCYQTFLNS